MLDPKKIILTQIFEGGGGGGDVEVEPLSITANGTYTAETGKAYSPVTANVPNSYAAGDEGKVVSNGALVSQTSDTATQNGTVDTTLINSLLVNVSGGGGASNIVAGTFTGTTAGAMDVSIPYSGSGFPLMFAIYVPYLANSGFASARRSHASGAIICVKGNASTPQYTDTDDSKMFIGNIYKGNDMAFISNLSLGWTANRQVFNTSGASATSYDLVKFKDNKTFSVYISGTSGTDGFVDNVEYAYVVIYSS